MLFRLLHFPLCFAAATFLSLAGKSTTAAASTCAGASTPSIYTQAQAIGVLVVCTSSADTTPLAFYSSPTGERLAIDGAGTVTPPVAAVTTARVQTLTLGSAFTSTTCKISYAGVATGTLADTNVGTLQNALNALGLGKFTVSGASPNYIITYDSPAIGYLSDFVCTDATDAARTKTIATTTEQALSFDGYTPTGGDFTTTNVISLRTLPDTRDSTIGAGRSKVPIGYGMYLSLPAVYYNTEWTTVGGLVAAPFTVIVTVDIAEAWAAQTIAASVDVEDAECSNRGHCDRTTGTCACYEGYYGDHCGKQTILV